jgi:uncharacterized protein YdeI (YjbR/CyaY-like superfamily)
VHKHGYTHAGKNIVSFQPFTDLCALMFFKGALLLDPIRSCEKHLEERSPGPAVRAERRAAAPLDGRYWARTSDLLLVRQAL